MNPIGLLLLLIFSVAVTVFLLGQRVGFVPVVRLVFLLVLSLEVVLGFIDYRPARKGLELTLTYNTLSPSTSESESI